MKKLFKEITWWTVTIILLVCMLPFMIVGSVLIAIDNLRDIAMEDWKNART